MTLINRSVPSWVDKQFKETPCPKCGEPLTVEETEFFRSELCEHCLEHVSIIDNDRCCSAPDIRPAKLITSSGTVQVRNACFSCGDYSSVNLGGFSVAQKQCMPVIDQKMKENRWKLRSEASSRLYQKKSELYEARQQMRKKLWFEQYNRYLKSPEWQEKRTLVLKRDKHLCQACLNAFATQVHHKSYQFVDLTGSEPAFDLVAICTPCHDKIELMKKQIREQ